MARAGDEIAWGSGQAAALEGLRRRVGGSETTSFVSTLERSRRLGSPLAEQLRRQSATLRRDQRRAIEDQAAWATPKIQLVVALVLVPSVLLLIAANADTLINVGYRAVRRREFIGARNLEAGKTSRDQVDIFL